MQFCYGRYNVQTKKKDLKDKTLFCELFTLLIVIDDIQNPKMHEK